MAKQGVLRRLRVAAKTRLLRLEAAAERAAGELLEKSYRDTAEQSLRGADAVKKILPVPAKLKIGPKLAKPAKRVRKKAAPLSAAKGLLGRAMTMKAGRTPPGKKER